MPGSAKNTTYSREAGLYSEWMGGLLVLATHAISSPGYGPGVPTKNTGSFTKWTTRTLSSSRLGPTTKSSARAGDVRRPEGEAWEPGAAHGRTEGLEEIGHPGDGAAEESR